MPADVLKMDRAFIMNIEHDEKEIQLVELILGCELAQGYYFSRPLPADAFERKCLE